jgi:hypothetical protein
MEDDLQFIFVNGRRHQQFSLRSASNILTWKTTSNILTWKTTTNILTWRTIFFVNGRHPQISHIDYGRFSMIGGNITLWVTSHLALNECYDYYDYYDYWAKLAYFIWFASIA